MYTIKLNVTKTAQSNFSYIDFDSFQKALTVIVNQLAPHLPTRTRAIKLGFHDKCGKYLFGTDSIYLYNLDEYKHKESIFIKLFLHEFRHWFQDRILRVNFDNNYTGPEHNVAMYYKCPIEQDSRQFANTLWPTVKSLYNTIKKTQNKVKGLHQNPIKFYV